MPEGFSVESLKKSQEKIGQLYPILVSPSGEIIDGKHRLEANPNWERKKVKVFTKAEEILIRVHANYRRKVSVEETRNEILKLAEILNKSGLEKGGIANKLAEITPFSARYIRDILPDKYKMVSKARESSDSLTFAEVVPQTEQPDKPSTAEINRMLPPLSTIAVNCENCSVGTLNPQTYEGHMLCPVCFERAQKGELKFQKKRTPVKAGPIKIEPKVKESWEHRKARMHPQTSKMEQAILLALNEKGIYPETQREFCLQSTRPDYYFPNENLAVYLDGEQVHKHPDKDQALRKLLTKRFGIQVLPIPYTSFTKTTQDKILQQIIATKEAKM